MAAVRTDETALAAFPEKDAWVKTTMRRLRPLLRQGEPATVVELGSDNGLRLISLALMGYKAHGVEPLEDSVKQAGRLAAAMHAEIDIQPGVAEKLPYPDGFADCVVAFSVMEHTSDLDRALRECCRVLKPGGVLWFSISSAVCPRQHEIRRFPLFGWYPLAIKRRIMRWAATSKPALVAHTRTPAMHPPGRRGGPCARRALARCGTAGICGHKTARGWSPSLSPAHS